MAVKEKKIIFFQDVTATLGDGLAWIAPVGIEPAQLAQNVHKTFTKTFFQFEPLKSAYVHFAT